MKTSVKKYHLFHLLNDFSGSPSVLRQVAEALVKHREVHIVTSKSEGFLSNINDVTYNHISYSWNKSKLVTLFNFFKVQFSIFMRALLLPKDSVIYVNTLLPFGAAIGGKIRGLEVIYHLHEPQVNPQMLFSFLKWVAKKTSSKQIFVSNYLEKELSDICVSKRMVIHNSISNLFFDKANEEEVTTHKRFEVLMACSMKKYKGVHEFLGLAKAMKNIKFKLILNSSGDVFNDFVKVNSIPINCEVLSSQSDMSPHYRSASLLLNLSDRNEWVESFGLTLIEGMCYGLPVIGPVVGGPKEIIEDGVTGFCIDSKDQEKLIASVELLNNNVELYKAFSISAKQSCARFTSSRFESSFLSFIEK